ncbi:hypothetical protein BN7_2595 [Wickerhamomyces ciferrii]|uniref:Arf3-interacting protein 1 N-terminal domain-containing protein n=1 Tax=Wickerhamomyces ciferrii (strain ATCC 14091 / BCRC 22168 / CBS 111 / JCM 3599 / NBRC 0793 / NRRL Y-1031 F-60-10) TaxID=1206466 RepID=K0KPH0_WICCF|nr:uncharacterized protein BN7_2595 [Wickerhamomyces ciferrii]CCH43048.1 hypothetical protein BN7_2595 [Wickerhamomyces ciferrii]
METKGFPTTPTRIKHNHAGSEISPKSPAMTLQEARSVKYVISAEFDNKIGAVVRHQIPKRIPGFKENLPHLGELMIPNHSEHYTKEDYSVFILYKSPNGKYQLLPDDQDEFIPDSSLGLQHISLNEINTIFEYKNHDDDILFFYTVTKKIEDSNDERGGKVRSISVGTPLRNFIIFKHHITIAIQNYMLDNQLSHLLALFNTINSIDLTLYNQFNKSFNDFQKITQLNSEINNRLILPKLRETLLSNDSLDTENIRYKSCSLEQSAIISNQTQTTIEDPMDKILTKIPLHLSLTSSSNQIQTDLNLTKLILNFLIKFSTILNLTNYKNFNIMIYSSQSTDQLCQFILSLSKLFNGFNSSYFHNDKILYFPLIDLYNFDSLIEYDKKFQNTKIIGTNNPIMKENPDFYDFWYDLTTFEMIPNKSVLRSLEFFEKDVFIKTQDFLDISTNLLKGSHDFTTIFNTYQKFNIYEILKILKRNDINNESSEIDLKDYYLKMNKNLVLFDWIFEYKIIKLIETLEILFKNLIKSPEIWINEKILKSLDIILEFLSSNIKGHLEKFILLIELFPIKIGKIDDLLYQGDDIDEFGNPYNGFNCLFQLILNKDSEIRTRVVQLYNILKNSQSSPFIRKRINVFLLMALDECC